MRRALLGCVVVLCACSSTTLGESQTTDGGVTADASADGSGAGGAATGGSAGAGGSGEGGVGDAATGGAATGGGVGRAGTGGTDTSQWARDYQQGCSFDGDCTLVAEGDKCGCSGCDNAAVSREALDAWRSDWAAITCPPDPGPGTCVAGCAQRLPACADGTCTARTPVYVDPSQYDRSCHEDSDCHVVFTGEVCSACQCSAIAVNTGAYRDYLELVDGIHCLPGPGVCDCAAPTQATCSRETMEELGQCEATF